MNGLLEESLYLRYKEHNSPEFAVPNKVQTDFNDNQLSISIYYDFYHDTDSYAIGSNIQDLGAKIALDMEDLFSLSVRWNYAEYKEGFKLVYVVTNGSLKELQELFTSIRSRRDLVKAKFGGEFSPGVIEICRILTAPIFD